MTTRKFETHEFVVLTYPDTNMVSIRSKQGEGFIGFSRDLLVDLITVLETVKATK